jgi:hypothetical protein
MRKILAILIFASAAHAQHELKAVRATVLDYNVDGQNFSIRAADGKEYRLRWTSASKLANKTRKTDFSGIPNRGQDASFLLGYGWRQALEDKQIDVQRGYLYQTTNEKKPHLPNAESTVISGVLRPNGADKGTLVVNGQEYAVSVLPNSSFVTVAPTIASAIFRNTEDVRIWASRLDGEYFVHQVEFYSGDWPSHKKTPAAPKKTVSAGLHRLDPPRVINHAPATAKGNGFTREISKDFDGTLPKAANVTRRKLFNNNRNGNNRNNNNRNNNNNNNRNKKRR